MVYTPEIYLYKWALFQMISRKVLFIQWFGKEEFLKGLFAAVFKRVGSLKSWNIKAGIWSTKEELVGAWPMRKRVNIVAEE